MQEFISHLLKSSALIAIFYLAYITLLKQETSFMQNRKFLLVGLATSLVLPLIYLTQQEYIELPSTEIPYTVMNADIQQENVVIEEPTNWWQIGLYVYLFGVSLMSLRFGFQIYSLKKIINSGFLKKYKNLKLVRTNKDIKPFSFFNNIVYNPEKHHQKDLKLILKHEQIHAKQWHSLDVIFISVLCVVFWFNPFIWLYKKIIVQNLEFLADQDAVATIVSKKEYQKALVMASVGLQPAMTNQFYQSFIKKRIIMLNKSKKKNTSWKTILVIPFLCLFLYSFNLKKESIVLNTSKDNRSQYTDTVDNPEITGIGSYTETEKNNTQISPKRSISFEDLGEDALYILDNQNYKRDELEGKTIVFKSIQVIAPETALKQYGEKGKDGAVILSKTEFIEDFQEFLRNLDEKDEAAELQVLKITSVNKPMVITLKNEATSETTVPKNEASSEKKSEKNSKNFNKIICFSANNLQDTIHLLNGQLTSEKTLKNLEKGKIKEILYIPGNAKIQALYGSRASNGIKVIITNEKGVSYKKSILNFTGNNQEITKEEQTKQESDNKKDTKIYLLGNTKVNRTENGLEFANSESENQALFVINEKIVDYEEIQDLNPKNIYSVTVSKNEHIPEKYKEEATENGVIEIYTKNYKGKLPQKSTTFVYTIHPNETDEAIQNMVKTIQEKYNLEINIKKLKRDDSGMISSVKIKARHKGSSFWNVTYSESSSDTIDEFYMIMDTKKDDFKITSEKPKKI
ncbi:M56 family metallopeptidase [Zunongwangia sp. HRR-M8]|uniref:M56 family metallopeptidase n=1 Tax=Zunongwangia sp. HRR-M8 TaxID=3015170 RepID=UPI0022DDB9E8|nr:M56 family metallopeptidase [Zunongwangia sp. HRR-M8]WBL21469.1 M56 family metallopeptidase [Zunongwangia sp. HRR-M8]